MALVRGDTARAVEEAESVSFLDEQGRPFIQTRYRGQGYTTMQLEDLQIYPTFHREGKFTLRHPPTDIFYAAPFVAIERERVQNALVGKEGCYACLQEQLVHVSELRLIQDFLSMYRATPTMMYAHLSEYSHNDVNMAKLYDKDLKNMMQTLVTNGVLNNTFFLILGDHGFQRAESPLLTTSQGRVEDSMPALYLVPPPSLARDHPQLARNLAANTARLTSHFDTHQTLRQLLGHAARRPVEQLFRGYEEHGTSLLEEVGDRTCREAGVPDAYCQCLGGMSQLPAAEAEVWAAAVLADINKFLEPFSFCQKLGLWAVKEATVKKVTSIKKVTSLK